MIKKTKEDLKRARGDSLDADGVKSFCNHPAIPPRTPPHPSALFVHLVRAIFARKSEDRFGRD
jgi:hypothetical protein